MEFLLIKKTTIKKLMVGLFIFTRRRAEKIGDSIEIILKFLKTLSLWVFDCWF